MPDELLIGFDVGSEPARLRMDVRLTGAGLRALEHAGMRAGVQDALRRLGAPGAARLALPRVEDLLRIDVRRREASPWVRVADDVVVRIRPLPRGAALLPALRARPLHEVGRVGDVRIWSAPWLRADEVLVIRADGTAEVVGPSMLWPV